MPSTSMNPGDLGRGGGWPRKAPSLGTGKCEAIPSCLWAAGLQGMHTAMTMRAGVGVDTVHPKAPHEL